MDFLKKHYEKVVLIALFVIFALLLVHLYNIVLKTGEVKESDLQIPQLEPNYVVTKASDPKFNLPVLMRENSVLAQASARDKKDNKDFSDLMTVFKISRCGHCGYLIPRRVLDSTESCPMAHCGKKLLAPKAEVQGAQAAARLDSDDDGIPNIIELENNLNPYDAHDAYDDLDDDGFVNVYEYKMNTDMKKADNHPPLYSGLYLVSIDRQPLKATLLGVSVLEGRDKAFWDIQMLTHEQRIKGKNRKEEKHYLSIGRRVQLDTGFYTIDDILSNEVEKMVDNKMQKVTEYSVRLKDRKGRMILMKVNEVAYDPDDKAQLKDIWSEKIYNVRVNSNLRMGSTAIGFSTYKVQKIEKRTNSVTVISTEKNSQPVVIKRKPMIPEEYIPSKEKKEPAAEGNVQQAAADGTVPGARR